MNLIRINNYFRAILICILAAVFLTCMVKPSWALCKPAVYCGPNDSFALKEDGTVWAWGNNVVGQLGDGSYKNRPIPVQVKNLQNIKSIAARYLFSYALDEQGTLYGWGRGAYGSGIFNQNILDYELPLYDAKRNDYFTGVIPLDNGITSSSEGYDATYPINLNIPYKTDVIACNYNHFCAYKPHSTWMAISYYQICNIFHRLDMSPDKVGFQSIIPCGYNDEDRNRRTRGEDKTFRSWLGLADDGQVWFKEKAYLSAKIDGLSNVIDIAGDLHYAALKSDGSVWIWGDNSFGQLGDGTVESSETPHKVNGISDVSQIAIAGGHTLALKKDGTVWAWGLCGVSKTRSGKDNKGTIVDVLGQTRGLDPSAPVYKKVLTPTLVSGLSDITYIAAGVYHCMAIKADGTVWAWGYNDFGELGDGTRINSETPVMVKDFNVLMPATNTKS